MAPGNGENRVNDSGQRYFFGQFILDIDRGTLLKHGQDVPLRPKTFEALCYLVRHSGVLVTRQQLQEAVWPSAVVSDESLTQCLAEVRKTLDDVSRDMIRTVPRRGYIFDVAVTIDAPAGEADSSVSVSGRSDPSGPSHGKTFERAVIGLLTLVVAFIAIDRFILGAARDASEDLTAANAEQVAEPALLDTIDDKSVAVLPFANRSALIEDEYFTDGMHDELLSRLSQISALKVISRTSVMRYEDTRMSIPDIARELGVAAIVEGGVQRSGNQVRVNIQLINAATDEHLWAEIYDREITAENLFAMQSEISSSIAQSLQATLSPREKSRVFDLPTASIDAYEHFLKGRQLMATGNAADNKEAQRQFEMAVEIDPKFALGWVGVADAIHLSPVGNRTKLREKHRQAAEKALQLDDELGEAYTSLASYYDEILEVDKAESAYLKAIELNPNYAQTYHWYAGLIDARLDGEKKLALLYKAAQLDPISLAVQLNIGQTLRILGREDEALDQLNELLDREPGFADAYRAIGQIHWNNFRLAEAARWFQLATERDPENPWYKHRLARLYIPLGEVDRYEKLVTELKDKFGANSVHNQFLGPLLLVIEDDWDDAVSGADDSYLRNSESIVKSNRDWQKVIDFIEALPADPPPAPSVEYLRLFAHAMMGEYEPALEIYLEQQPNWINPEHWPEMLTLARFAWGEPCLLAGIMIGSGRESLGLALVNEINNTPDQKFVWNVNPAVCHLVSGDYDQALAWFEEKAANRRYVEWERFGSYPWWDPMKDDPRFLGLWKRNLEMMAEQRALFRQSLETDH